VPTSALDQILSIRKKLEKHYDSELFPPFDASRPIDVIPSPSAIINAVTGVGGTPRGRIVEILGPEATGKTTLAMEYVAELHRRDPTACALYLDFEHTLDPGYAKALGIDLDPARFIFVQPDYFEQGDAILSSFLEADLIDIGVVDTLAAAMPLSQYQGEADPGAGEGKSKDPYVGLHARTCSRALNQWKTKIARGRKPALVLVNQVRKKFSFTGYGSAVEEGTGGLAPKFYSTIRLSLEPARGEGKEERDTKAAVDQLHQRVRVRVTAIKNKVAPPFRRGTMVIEFGKGISNAQSTIDLAIMYLGIKNGSWFKYDGDTDETSFSCQGRGSLVDLLKANPATQRELELKALEKLQLSDAAPPTPPDVGEDDLVVASPGGTEKIVVLAEADPNDQGQTNAPQEADGALPVEDL
jgi:recombination protein RecA